VDSPCGKAPGDVDLPVAPELKRMIRESEAELALEAVGLPPSAARFLDLPFYRTGEARKRPIGEEDVAIFKHQSRKDTAPVPGGHDDREFCWRVEARNLEAATRADRLGLPEYFAMEAYVVDRECPAPPGG
jgi:hypothetical protein